MAEQIIIEFLADTSGLVPAEDKLAALGKIDQQAANVFKSTNAELKNRTTEVNKISQANEKQKNSIATLSKAVKDEGQVLKLTSQEFKKMGVTLEQLVAQQKGQTVETTKTTTASKNLRTELRQLTEQLTRLKLEGKENTEQYKQLSAQASRYRDALGDVTREVNRAASDTRKLDTMIEFGQGIAATFAIAQAGAALFGDENEELQEVLVKVTSAMVLLNGLQTIGNLLQKESNIIRAVTNTQLRLSVIATNLETAAHSRNIVIKGLATAAMRVLNTVMSANPALLLVAAFAALAAALSFFTSKTDKSKEATERLNEEMERTKTILETNRGLISAQAEIDLKNLELAGAKESELSARRIQALKEERAEANKTTRELTTQIQRLANAQTTVQKEAFNNLVKERKAALDLTTELGNEIEKAEIDRLIQLRDERKKADEESLEAFKKRQEREKELRLAGFEDFKAIVEKQLLHAASGSERELEIKKKLLKAELQIALENEKLTENQRALLVQQFFKKRGDLDREFYKNREKLSTENAISLLNSELANISLSHKERERLTIYLLNRQRDLELQAVENNKVKEKEINARFDKEIAEQRLAIKQAALDKELLLEERTGAARKRRDEQLVQDESQPAQKRIEAAEDLAARELGIIERHKQAKREQFAGDLINQEEFNLSIAELQDQELQVYENLQKTKTEINKREKDKRLEDWKAEATQILSFASQGLEVLNTLSSNIALAQRQRVDDELQRLQNLRDAGAITDKQFIEGQKKVDLEKRRLQQQDAIREKNFALFQAFINMASAIVKALPNIPLSLIVGALGLAQIGAIAARPIPKFRTGKQKGGYEGMGEVGEAGAEIIERQGRMYVVEKPTVLWLGKQDKVFNPTETKAIMEKQAPLINKKYLNGHEKNGHGFSIDYEKLGKTVGKNIPQTVLNITEKGMTKLVKEGNSYTEYLESRRKF